MILAITCIVSYLVVMEIYPRDLLLVPKFQDLVLHNLIVYYFYDLLIITIVKIIALNIAIVYGQNICLKSQKLYCKIVDLIFNCID